ncbi:MAG: DNA adenine methylase [Candidatus Marinimicrobia bacterium]|nr:DNA adenine methylase [Candidatus Neomarinimicrobiota bacterium]
MKNYKQINPKSAKVEDLFYEYNVGAKPFLKWVGGKRQLLKSFQSLYPKLLKKKKIKNYYEPFVGGGAVFFDVVQNFEIENAFLYDINEELILTYLVIQNNVNELIDFLYRYDKQYKKLNEEQRKEYFYDLRKSFNFSRFNIDYNNYSENWISRAAQIIFLNKTCFNGLFRFNSKGEFNSPMGKYKNPKIVDEQNLLNVSKLLEITTIKKADYSKVINDLNGDSTFIYFDPPYKPISKTSSFTAYSKTTFQDDDQIQLSKLFYDLNEKGYSLMLSNSDPKNIDPSEDFFDKIYKDYKITRVNAKRSINSNPNKRNSIKEIVITNY